MSSPVRRLSETTHLGIRAVLLLVGNGIFAILLGGGIAAAAWAFRVVVAGNETGNFIGTWNVSFWVLYPPLLAWGAWNIYANTLRPALRAAKKYGCTFREGLDYRHHSERFVRFQMERPEGYEPWNTERFMAYLLTQAVQRP